VSLRQACLNRCGELAMVAVLVGEDRDECERAWLAVGFVARAATVRGLAGTAAGG
jgi:hypothetical protein